MHNAQVNRHLIIILKWSRDFLLYTKKETSSVLFYEKYGCYFYLPRKFYVQNTLSEPEIFDSLHVLLCVLNLLQKTRTYILFCDKTRVH